MRNSTKMGGTIKKKYQSGGSKLDPVKTMDAFKKGAIKNPKMRMNPSKIAVPGSAKKMTPAQKKAAIDKFMKMAPKKQKGGVIPAKPIATAPIQGKTGRRAAAGSNMAKGGQKFPDLNRDGKVTKADILRGRGVYGNKKKKYGNGGGPGDGDPVVPPATPPPAPPAAPGAPGAPGFYDLALKAAQGSPRGARVALRNARKYERNNNQTNEDIKVAEATKTRKGSAFGAGAAGLGSAFSGLGNFISSFKPTPSINVTPPAGGMKKGGQKRLGFKAVQSKIAAKQGVSKKAAGAILASSTRKSSAKAKAANPRLRRVKG